MKYSTAVLLLIGALSSTDALKLYQKNAEYLEMNSNE